MATYYASQFIPTVDVNATFDFAFYYSDNFYAPTTGTMANFAATVTEIETQYNGNLTYLWSTVSGGKMLELTYETPDVTPVMFIMAVSGGTANMYNFPFSVVLTCTGCGSVQWAECEEDYTIDLGLTPSTLYNYTLTHGQTGIEYTQNSTTDGSGVTTWDTYLMPELYVSGNVFVLTATNGAEDVTFTYNGTEYSCMQITIVKQINITD